MQRDARSSVAREKGPKRVSVVVRTNQAVVGEAEAGSAEEGRKGYADLL